MLCCLGSDGEVVKRLRALMEGDNTGFSEQGFVIFHAEAASSSRTLCAAALYAWSHFQHWLLLLADGTF